MPTQQQENNYLYIFVRKDLSPEQIAVQSCHAATEATRHYITLENYHPSIIILQAANEAELESITLYLSENGIKCKGFYESYYNNSLTALGTELICGERRKLLRQFELLKY